MTCLAGEVIHLLLSGPCNLTNAPEPLVLQIEPPFGSIATQNWLRGTLCHAMYNGKTRIAMLTSPLD